MGLMDNGLQFWGTVIVLAIAMYIFWDQYKKYKRRVEESKDRKTQEISKK